jgi:hypothetical protein
MAFALGAHLKGDYALSLRILDTYEQHFLEVTYSPSLFSFTLRRCRLLLPLSHLFHFRIWFDFFFRLILFQGDDEFDASEVIMYKNMVLEEMGDYKRALAHLEQFKSKVVDRLSWKEKRGMYLCLHLNSRDSSNIRMGRRERHCLGERECVCVSLFPFLSPSCY